MLEKEISLGEFLRHERERRGITLEQVASSTKVGIRTLHALEGDQYSELPAKPFIRGFVTSYSRFIGLDPKDILTRFDGFIAVKSKERPSRDAGHSGYAFEKRDGEHQSRTVLLVAISGFIVVGGLAMLVLKPGVHRSLHRSHIDQLRLSHSRERDSSQYTFGKSTSPFSQFSPVLATSAEPASGASLGLSLNPEAIESPRPPAQKEGAATPEGAAEMAAEAATEKELEKKEDQSSADPLDSGLALDPKDIKHKVVFKVLQDVWVRYQVDERPVRKFVIRKDRVLVLRAKDQIQFQVSDPDSITFNYNGKGNTLVSQDPKLFTRQDTATLVFPQPQSEKQADLGDAFRGQLPLPEEVPPPPVLSTPQRETE